jgi:hypothetical protein
LSTFGIIILLRVILTIFLVKFSFWSCQFVSCWFFKFSIFIIENQVFLGFLGCMRWLSQYGNEFIAHWVNAETISSLPESKLKEFSVILSHFSSFYSF